MKTFVISRHRLIKASAVSAVLVGVVPSIIARDARGEDKVVYVGSART